MNGQKELGKFPWSYGLYDDGTPISATDRHIFKQNPDNFGSNPYKTKIPQPEPQQATTAMPMSNSYKRKIKKVLKGVARRSGLIKIVRPLL